MNPVPWITNPASHTPVSNSISYFIRGCLVILFNLYNRPSGFAVAAQVVILAYLTLNEEIETAKAQSQVLLNDLGETHRQLKIYASQIEEMAVIQERNRLAKTLHDTVHQLIFSISLTTRSAELLLEKDPKQVSIELNQLQTLTVEVLSHLRSIIHQLKPEQKS